MIRHLSVNISNLKVLKILGNLKICDWKAKLSSTTWRIYVKNENGFKIVKLEHMSELRRLKNQTSSKCEGC
ncbi:hypothetical protein IEQ34_007159 [Dendrobium chrysotoxum]|uniref:Uncharacterized protein n=1 Tax=Dendrobium chrysotoxum TaxID=161865 RepID=A0AAV7HA58_DENCH|nr:hypothetical protein IEQ34_007159 [Dendrobium chrysotoxum]